MGEGLLFASRFISLVSYLELDHSGKNFYGKGVQAFGRREFEFRGSGFEV